METSNRRNFIATAGATGLALGLTGKAWGSHEGMPAQSAALTQYDALTLECINACTGCQNVCLQTRDHCIGLGGEHANADLLRLLSDCERICRLSADYSLGRSTFSMQSCSLCADVCDACAAACAAFTKDNVMHDCATACTQCADTCARMASA
jgi:hypothetical protein